MAGAVSIDTSEVTAFVIQMERALDHVPREVRDVIQKGAQNLKNEYTAQARGSRHFKGMAGSISYDMSGNKYFSSAEVGPDKARRGGALGNLFFFGGANGGGGTGDFDGPIDAERPRMIAALADVVAGIV